MINLGKEIQTEEKEAAKSASQGWVNEAADSKIEAGVPLCVNVILCRHQFLVLWHLLAFLLRFFFLLQLLLLWFRYFASSLSDWCFCVRKCDFVSKNVPSSFLPLRNGTGVVLGNVRVAYFGLFKSGPSYLTSA